MTLAASLPDLVGMAFAPLNPFLQSPDVVEICVNRPGCVFVERSSGQMTGMEEHAIPDLTAERIRFMAERIAAASHQFVNDEEPILSASLSDGERVQAVLPPAALDGGAIVIRRQTSSRLTLADYGRTGALAGARIIDSAEILTQDEAHLCHLLDKGDLEQFFSEAVQRRVSILVSGGTGSGKTTFLNALLQEIPRSERLITIEDTPEISHAQPNHVRLIATRGQQNIANVDPRHLVEASLRMRPDRLLLGEIRGAEAMDFLQAINTGHPGSLSTVHANSPKGAYLRLALLIMQASGGAGLNQTDMINALQQALPLTVQIARVGGRPGVVTEIFYEPFLRWADMQGDASPHPVVQVFGDGRRLQR